MNRAATSDLHADKKKILLGGISFILSSATLATQYNPEKHHRRSIRLTGYDYKQSGAYFVTIVTRNRVCLFGDISDGEMVLSDTGRIAEMSWVGLSSRFSNCVFGFLCCHAQPHPRHYYGRGAIYCAQFCSTQSRWYRPGGRDESRPYIGRNHPNL